MILVNPTYQFTCYANLLSVEQPESIMNINELIEIVQFGYLKDQVTAVRGAKDKKEKDNLKMNTLPAVTLSGTFGYRSSKGFVKHSGLMQIDIDDVANYNQVFERLCTDAFTYVAFRSPSGNGIKVIVKIGDSKDTHLGQFNALREYYDEQYQIEIDTACKDLARCMLLSWDPNLYCNPFSQVFDGYAMPEEKQVNNQRKSFPVLKEEYALDQEKIIAFISRELALRKIDITTPFQNWIQLGFSIANTLGETGRNYYHEISSVYPEYKADEIDKVYSGMLKKNDGRVTLGTLIYHAKEAGVDLSPLYEKEEVLPLAPKKKEVSEIDLYNKIKEWRYKKSKEMGKPAFTIFPNKVIDELIAVKPTNLGELIKVKGMGKQKIEQCGKELLDLLRE